MADGEGGHGWASARTMALVAAALFFAGGVIGALTLLLPHPAVADDPMLWTNVGIGFAGALLLGAFAGRLPTWAIQLFIVAGTLAVTRAVYLSHDPGTFYGFWYVWIGIYAIFFFGRRWGFAHVALIGAAYAWALAQQPQTSPVARWVMTIATIAIAGVLVDVLAGRARRALLASRESEQRARAVAAIVESSDDAIIGMTPRAVVTSWNRGAERLYGYSADEMLGAELAPLVPDDRWDEVVDILTRLAAGQRIETMETQRLAKGGKVVDVSVTYSPISDADGRISRVAVVARDIGERKRRESHTAAQHAATQVFADASTVSEGAARLLTILVERTGWALGAWWLAETKGAGLRCEGTVEAGPPPSRSAEALPFAPGATIDAEALARLPEGGLEAVWSADLEASPPLPHRDAARRSKIGSALWLPVASRGTLFGAFYLLAPEPRQCDDELLAVLRSLGGQFASFVDRRRAEEEAEQVKDDFLGLVSHELRTPLTSIIGYTELLTDPDSEPLTERQREFLEVVRRNAHRELRLVRDLLLLVRIKAGTFSIEPQTVKLEEVVEGSVEAARPRANEAEITLVGKIESVPPTWADPDRLAQVVDNLLSNALKFTPPGGRVEVRLGSRLGTAVIEVEDTGVGIPPEEQARLFDRLFRASSATAKHVPGVGLGLTIVRALVESHGGRVEVSSQSGEGTTFRVELPLAGTLSATPLAKPFEQPTG